MAGLDDLLLAWRHAPDAERTLTLCAAVREPVHAPLAREVLALARSAFLTEPGVLLEVGRMLMRVGLLGEAQTPLALAGKADPSDWRPFLELGRLLLLRGDAVRGTQAFRRALAMGCQIEQLAAWSALAEELVALQKTAGVEAVAEEAVRRALPWPDDGSSLAVGPEFVSQVARTVPPPAGPGTSVSEGEGGEKASPSPPPTLSSRHVQTLADTATMADPRVLFARFAQLGLASSNPAETLGWQRASRSFATGAWVLASAALVSALLLLGAYGMIEQIQSSRVKRAVDLSAAIERKHASGRIEDVRAAELDVARLFELDVRRTQTTELWLENRALAVLLLPDRPAGMSDALRRVEFQGLSPVSEALGRLVQRFEARDVSGAQELIPQFDGFAGGSARYQFAAAVVLEHAGDPGAIDRYRRTIDVDPDFAPAHVLLARLALLERGASPGRSATPALGFGLDEHPIGQCLRRLYWALDPTREHDPPTGELRDDQLALLPRPLQPVPHLVEAVQAIGRQERERAAEQLEMGLRLAETPAAIARFGLVALQAGDLRLARRAAIRVHAIAPEYPLLSVLAARIALLQGHLDEAEGVVAAVDASRRQLAIAHAVVSYEMADDRGVAIASRALGSAVREDPDLAAVALFASVLRGRDYPEADRLQDLAVPAVLWGELLAVDNALDSGKLDLARALVRSWGPARQALAPFAVRVARLARYAGEPKRAMGLALLALREADPTPRALVEAIVAQLELDRVEAARNLLDTHASLLGAHHRWLDVLIIAQERSAANARVRSSRLPLPRADAPLAVWVLAARAFVAGGDARGRETVERLLADHPGHPELVAALRHLDE